MVVYRNLLFSAHSVQAGGQDKITEVRQEIQRFAFGFPKASRVCVESQFGITMSRKFPDNLGGDLTVRREADTGIPQGMKGYLIAVFVRQFNSRRR